MVATKRKCAPPIYLHGMITAFASVAVCHHQTKSIEAMAGSFLEIVLRFRTGTMCCDHVPCFASNSILIGTLLSSFN